MKPEVDISIMIVFFYTGTAPIPNTNVMQTPRNVMLFLHRCLHDIPRSLQKDARKLLRDARQGSAGESFALDMTTTRHQQGGGAVAQVAWGSNYKFHGSS